MWNRINESLEWKVWSYELKIKDDEILVGYLGSYNFYHDSVRLVLAADILRKQGKKPTKILMVGTGKEYRAVIDSLDNEVNCTIKDKTDVKSPRCAPIRAWIHWLTHSSA